MYTSDRVGAVFRPTEQPAKKEEKKGKLAAVDEMIDAACVVGRGRKQTPYRRGRMMRIRTLKVAGLLAVAAASLLVSGCLGTVRAGELHTESRAVALDGVESVRAEVDIGSGDLQVSGGGREDLLAARFTSNVAGKKPRIVYDLSGDQGTLKVHQPETNSPNITIGNVRRKWDLRLNDRVPLDGLRISADTGDTNLDLTGLAIRKLNVELGTGELNVDLDGEWKQDLEPTIQADTGNTTLRLPGDVGVRVDVEGGIDNVNATDLLQDTDAKGSNTYVNDTFGESEKTLLISIENGVGEVDLEVVE